MTAEEFLDSKSLTAKIGKTEAQELLVEFAKKHCESALKEASKKVKRKEGQIVDYKLTTSILNAYPLENIK